MDGRPWRSASGQNPAYRSTRPPHLDHLVDPVRNPPDQRGDQVISAAANGRSRCRRRPSAEVAVGCDARGLDAQPAVHLAATHLEPVGVCVVDSCSVSAGSQRNNSPPWPLAATAMFPLIRNASPPNIFISLNPALCRVRRATGRRRPRHRPWPQYGRGHDVRWRAMSGMSRICRNKHGARSANDSTSTSRTVSRTVVAASAPPRRSQRGRSTRNGRAPVITPGQPHVDGRHLVGPTRRAPLALRFRRTDQGPALRGGQAQEHRGPLVHDQGAAREGGRALTATSNVSANLPAGVGDPHGAVTFGALDPAELRDRSRSPRPSAPAR